MILLISLLSLIFQSFSLIVIVFIGFHRLSLSIDFHWASYIFNVSHRFQMIFSWSRLEFHWFSQSSIDLHGCSWAGRSLAWVPMDSGRSQDGSPSADLGQGQDQHWNLDRGTRGAALAGGSCGSTAEVKYSKKHTENANHEHPPLHADYHLGQWFHCSLIFIDFHGCSLICIGLYWWFPLFHGFLKIFNHFLWFPLIFLVSNNFRWASYF